jgi:hypothetical protein
VVEEVNVDIVSE